MELVLLDRDGVINEDSDNYIRSVDEWLPIPGSIDAIARLSKAGFQVVVCSNQSGIDRGYFSVSELDTIHGKMTMLVEQAGGNIAGIFYCPHLPDAGCSCRKPQPGLIDQACAELQLSPVNSPFVGDSLKDLEAAKARDCRPVLVKTGKGTKAAEQIASNPELADTAIFDNLASFVDHFLAQQA